MISSVLRELINFGFEPVVKKFETNKLTKPTDICIYNDRYRSNTFTKNYGFLVSHLLLEQYAVIQNFLPASIFPFQKQVCFSIFVPYTLYQLLSKNYFNAPLCTGHHCNKRHWPKNFQCNLLTVCLLLGSTNSSTTFIKICNFFLILSLIFCLFNFSEHLFDYIPLNFGHGSHRSTLRSTNIYINCRFSATGGMYFINSWSQLQVFQQWLAHIYIYIFKVFHSNSQINPANQIY